MARRAGHPGSGAEAGRGHVPAHVADVRGAHLLAKLEGLHLAGRGQRPEAPCAPGGKRLPKRIGERHFGLVVVDAVRPQLFLELFVQQPGQGVVAQQREVAVHHLVLHARAGAERGAFGGLSDALEEAAQHAAVRVAHVVVHLGEFGDDVRRLAAAGDHIVHPGIGGDVLAQQVRHHVHGLDAVEGRTPAVRRGGGMGCPAMKAESRRHVGRAALRRRDVAVRRMPMQHDVHIVENSSARQIDLAGTALLGRRAVDADGAGRGRRRQPVAERGGGDRRCGAEQVMAAGMAGCARGDGQATRHRRLGEAGQGVVLGENADDGRALAALGEEGRRDVCQPGLDAEAVVFEEADEAGRAAGLLVAEFGVVEDVARDADCLFAPRLHQRGDVRAGCRQRGEDEPAAEAQHPAHGRVHSASARAATRLEMLTLRRPWRSGLRSWPLVQ